MMPSPPRCGSELDLEGQACATWRFPVGSSKVSRPSAKVTGTGDPSSIAARNPGLLSPMATSLYCVRENSILSVSPGGEI